MKKLLVGAVLIAASSGAPTFAADMPLKAPPPPVVVYNWTGCYLGLSIGDSWGRSQHTADVGTTAIRGGVPVTLAAGTSIADRFNLWGFLDGPREAAIIRSADGCSALKAIGRSRTKKARASKTEIFLYGSLQRRNVGSEPHAFASDMPSPTSGFGT